VKNLSIPLEMSEEKVLACIEYVARTLAPGFVFGYYSLEDVKQECRIWALDALVRYDIKRGALSTFLMTHVRNRLINFRRDKLYRMPPECGCTSCLNGVECDKIKRKKARWKKLNTTKRDLMQSESIQGMEFDKSDDDTLDSDAQVLKQELATIINSNLPIEMRADYRRFLDGVKIPNSRREEIIGEIKDILQRLEYNE
jgi:DNA-directed RNA polymerase specialized sigma24 family protein